MTTDENPPTENQPAEGPVNPSLQKKTAARMAAVQCLYTLSINGEKLSPGQHIILLKKQLLNNRSEQKLRSGVPLEPNYKLMETLLEGIERCGSDIDTRLKSTLSSDWSPERMSPLLIAIMRCGIFEMFFNKEISAKIIIDEYTRITRSFFSDAEVGFVHGALSKLARKYG